MPRDLRAIPVGVALAAAVVVGAVYYVKAIDQLGDRAHANSELSYSDREVAGGNSIVVDQEAANEAQVLIPRSATFRVRVAPDLPNATSLTSTFAESWYRYFLMPRRPADDAHWVICYGCDTSELGAYVVRWHDDQGISILRRR
jgi:hypothetical protein